MMHPGGVCLGGASRCTLIPQTGPRAGVQIHSDWTSGRCSDPLRLDLGQVFRSTEVAVVLVVNLFRWGAPGRCELWLMTSLFGVQSHCRRRRPVIRTQRGSLNRPQGLPMLPVSEHIIVFLMSSRTLVPGQVELQLWWASCDGPFRLHITVYLLIWAENTHLRTFTRSLFCVDVKKTKCSHFSPTLRKVKAAS